MEATILLCDSAEAVNGKLYILGGGWSVTGPDPQPSALAMKIDVPWTDANRKISVKVDLLTEDGQPVLVPSADGTPRPVGAGLEFEVGRPAGVPPGTDLDATLAFTIPPVPLPAGRRFRWNIEIDGETRPHWQVAFTTRDARSGPAGSGAIPPL